MNRRDVGEVAVLVLLTVTWVTLTLGIAQANWLLVGSGLPSLALATVLHFTLLRTRP